MNFNKFKISINILGGIFLLLIFFISLFPPEADAPLAQIFIRPALAQDAIQCTPADVNLNRNLKFINTTDDTANDIYLGTGEIYFGGTFVNTPYATNSSGNLLFRNGAAQVITQSDTILLQNTAGDRIAGAYNGNPSLPATIATGNHYFIVDGKIEGWEVHGLNQLCVGGNCAISWGDAVTKGGGLKVENDPQVGALTSGKWCTTNGSVIDCTSDAPGAGSGITSIVNTDGNLSVAISGTTATINLIGGGGGGVSKIIAGSGITVSSATGDVTISAALECSDVGYAVGNSGVVNDPAPSKQFCLTGWSVTGWSLAQSGYMVCCHLQ